MNRFASRFPMPASKTSSQVQWVKAALNEPMNALATAAGEETYCVEDLPVAFGFVGTGRSARLGKPRSRGQAYLLRKKCPDLST